MTSPSPLLQRLKQARIVQVLLVYLGASWVVLQLVETLVGLLSLPDWVGPVTVVLLGVGLVVVMATAWVQSLPSTTAAEEAGEVPSDWEVAPGDVVSALKAGRLPHLTWGRAILGGVVALSVLFGAAGAYVFFTGGEGLMGPAEAGADEVATGIAVLPFQVSGDDFDLYREGMVDLLSTTLDGVAGYRTIDSRTVLARWEEEVGSEARPDLSAALRAAGRTGARYAVLGSLVPAGSDVRLAVEVYDLDEGSEVGSAQVVGEADDILALVDELSVGVAREVAGRAAAPNERTLASMSTSSVEALEHLLEGMRHIRRGEFVEAEAPLEEAVSLDSTFALAWAQLAEARGWISDRFQASSVARERAYELRDRMAPREAMLTEARYLYNIQDPEAKVVLLEYARRYPDDPEVWYQLADLHLHQTEIVSAPRADIVEWLEKAVSLDPGFAVYRIHLVELYLAMADAERARDQVEAYEAAGAEVGGNYALTFGLGPALVGDDPEARRAALDSAAESENPMRALGIFSTDLPWLEVELAEAALESGPNIGLALARWRAGKWEASDAWLEDQPDGSLEAVRVLQLWRFLWDLGEADEMHRRLAAAACPGADPCGLESMRVWHGARAGHGQEVEAGLAVLSDRLEEVRARGDTAVLREAEDRLRRARAVAALESGDPAEALALARERLGKGPVDFFLLAMAAEAAGELETAAEHYAGRAWQPLGPFATYRWARVLERLGRPAEALEQYQRLEGMWKEADEDFVPLTEVRESIQRLDGDG